MDYGRVDRIVAEQQPALKRAYPLSKGKALPNQYLLAEGKLIEADTAIYEPIVISDDPAQFFADYPGQGGGG
jgi:hypothetical protein